MQKLLMLLLFIVLLSGCSIPGEKEIINSCTSDEVLVEGECIDVSLDIPWDDSDVFCADNEIQLGICIDLTKPVFTYKEVQKIPKGEPFNYLDYVSALDDVDGDVTDQITINGTVDVNQYGTYFVTYRVSDSLGNEAVAFQEVIVSYDETDTTLMNLIGNGDFSNADISPWYIEEETWRGSEADAYVENGVLTVDILGTHVDGYEWTPKLRINNLRFIYGETYYISFDAWSDEGRIVNFLLGDLYSYDPWFTNFMPYTQRRLNLNTYPTTYEYMFTMEHSTNSQADVFFEMGNIYDYNLETTIYFDNFKLYKLP